MIQYLGSTFLVSVMLTFIFATQAMAAQERTISVQGNCLRSAQPNRASVDFYAESLNKDAQKAMQEAGRAFQAARAEVQKMGLKDLELETLENSVREEKAWENNTQVFKGYKARVGLRVITQEISKIGAVIEAVSKKGVKNIGQLITDMSPTRLKAEQEACLEQAIGNARSKANRMAKAAGAKVGKVISIVESYENRAPHPHPIAYSDMVSTRSAVAMSAESAPSFAAPIDVRAQDISMSVSVMFTLE